MPGSGKSTLGKKLAKKLGWGFFDLDARITETTAISPARWIEQSGEPAFREIESQTLRALDLSADAVVSCGGGTPCFNDNLGWMKQNGICLFIDLPLKTIFDRLTQKDGINSRPLVSGENPMLQLEQLWKKRKPFFEQIDWWEDGLTVDATALTLKLSADGDQLK